jgi:hypothetical protein
VEPESKEPRKKKLHFLLPAFLGMAAFVAVMFAWLLGWNPLHYLLSSPAVPAQTTVINDLTNSGEVIDRSYSWSYDRHNWSWSLAIPEDLYIYFSSMERAPVADYSLYATHPLDDAFLEELASRLNEESRKSNFDDVERLQFAAAFVQDLAYLPEAEEYPRYPVETLVDKGGDCEDTAILMASLLQSMRYDVVLVNLSSPSPDEPGHMAVGVSLQGFSGGTRVVSDGGEYYYLETTSTSDLGFMPEDYMDYDISIYQLERKPVLKLSSLKWTVYPWPRNTLTLETTVTNWGTLDAADARVRAFFEGNEIEAKTSPVFDLEYGHRISPITVNEIELPSQGRTLRVQIVLDGKVVDEWATAVA